MRPSFIGHALNGFLVLAAIFLFFRYYKTLSSESMIEIVLLFSIAFGVHAILHHYEEIYYDFNPYRNKWMVNDDAILTVRNIK